MRFQIHRHEYADVAAMASSFKRSDTIAVKYLENPEVVSPYPLRSVITMCVVQALY